jgi:hypothetical protein
MNHPGTNHSLTTRESEKYEWSNVKTGKQKVSGK